MKTKKNKNFFKQFFKELFMMKNMLLTLVSILLFVSFAFAQTDESPSDDSKKSNKNPDDLLEEANKELRGSDEEELEEQINPIEVLTKIVQLMAKAKDKMSRAATTKLNPDEIKKIQQQIDNEFEKLFKGTKENQDDAIKNIEKLIKYAKQCQSQSQQNQQKQQKPNEKPQPDKTKNQNQQKPNANDPAKEPYKTKTEPPLTNPLVSKGTAQDKWGILPAKIQDIILQSRLGETLQQYQERIEKYFKVLSEEE